MEAKHTITDLRQMQSLSLESKVNMTCNRIRGWIDKYGEDGVYVSFSGGKDSTVLLDLVRNVMGYKRVPAVFVDTGLEYPELREFVKTFDNVTWLKPRMNFKQVIEKYGYPLISKEVSECVYGARKYLDNLIATEAGGIQDDSYHYFYEKLFGLGKYAKEGKEELNRERLAEILKQNMEKGKGQNVRLAKVLGMFTKDNQITAEVTKDNKSAFGQTKWQFFLLPDAPRISAKCCNIMKKEPAHKYAKETGRKPMTAEMAAESRLRTQRWLLQGCNGFDMKEPKSMPMAFWTEQDVLQYIKQHNLPIAPVYGEIVEKEQYQQLSLFDEIKSELETTGCNRTGCVFCGYGCHLEKPEESRFKRLKETHPQIYDYIMKSKEEGGLNYKEIFDWINEHNGKGTIFRY